jgi:hypothetical protein
MQSRTRIKVKFPDGYTLLASFGQKESISAVYAFISSQLRDESLKFELFDTPPKRVLAFDDQKCLFEDAKLVPSATLFFQTAEMHQTPFLKHNQ